MPPTSKRRPSRATENVASDGTMRPPPPGRTLVRHSDPETTDGNGAKKKRVISPRPEDVPAESDSSQASGRQTTRSPRSMANKVVAAAECGSSAGMRADRTKLANDLMAVVVGCALEKDEKMKILEMTRRYEDMLIDVTMENSRLKGRLEELGGRPVPVVAPVAAAVSSAVAMRAPSGAPSKPPPAPFPTWAIAGKSKDEEPAEEVVSKVKKDVAPSLGVRVHQVVPTKGGAIIRTTSVAEQRKIVEKQKFGEVGLEVSIMDKLGRD